MVSVNLNTVEIGPVLLLEQEASEYVDHDILTGRFHVTHYAGFAILFNEDTFYPNIDVKSIDLHDTRRDLPDQVMEGEPGMGHARCSFTCLISSITIQRPEVLYSVVSTYQQHLRQEERHFLKKLTWLQVISMVLRGDVAAETTSVLLTKPILIVPCLRHRAPHHCGDPDPSHPEQLGRRLWISQTTGFSTLLESVHSPSHEKHTA